MSPFAMAGALTGVISLGSGIVVFLRDPSRTLNRLWLVFSGSIALWGCGSLWIALEADPTIALWAWRLSFLCGVLWIASVFFHFVCEFCGVAHPSLIRLGYGAGLLQCFLFLTDLEFSGVRIAFSSFFYAVPGPAFPLFCAYWVGLILVSHVILGKAFCRAAFFRRKQIGAFSLATLVGFTGGSLSYLPMYHVDWYPWGHFAIPLGHLLMAYAMVRYRVLDFTVALEHVVAFLALFAVTAIPSFGVLLWAQEKGLGPADARFTFLLLFLLALVAALAWGLRQRTEHAVGRLLFKQRHATAETLRNFSKVLVTILDQRLLAQNIVDTLVRVFEPVFSAIYILDPEKGLFVRAAWAGQASPPQDSGHVLAHDPFVAHLARQPGLIIREELEQPNSPEDFSGTIETLQKLDAEVCVPLMAEGRLSGFVMLGARKGGSGYANEDLDHLNALAPQVAIGVENTLRYEAFKRSQALLRRTDRLRSLEIMASGFAHEIRNPLTSIKAFVQLAPERHEDQEFLRHFGGVVFEDVTRIERLTQEILDFSQHAMSYPTDEDLNPLVESCLYFVQRRTQKPKVIVETHLQHDLPRVKVDRRQIMQVLLNLLFNAFEAMKAEGGVLRVCTNVLSKSDRAVTWVQVEIADTGCGIPQPDLDHVFDPFFTTKHESREREGTGLGLTIAHQIIQEHGGTISVNSAVNEGSTFLIALPVSHASAPPG